jgi:hypothetical protein
VYIKMYSKNYVSKKLNYLIIWNGVGMKWLTCNNAVANM